MSPSRSLSDSRLSRAGGLGTASLLRRLLGMLRFGWSRPMHEDLQGSASVLPSAIPRAVAQGMKSVEQRSVRGISNRVAGRKCSHAELVAEDGEDSAGHRDRQVQRQAAFDPAVLGSRDSERFSHILLRKARPDSRIACLRRQTRQDLACSRLADINGSLAAAHPESMRSRAWRRVTPGLATGYAGLREGLPRASRRSFGAHLAHGPALLGKPDRGYDRRGELLRHARTRRRSLVRPRQLSSHPVAIPGRPRPSARLAAAPVVILRIRAAEWRFGTHDSRSRAR